MHYETVSFDAKVFRVFIASPTDLTKQRKWVEEAISGWNRNHASDSRVVFLPVGWEGAVPEQGGDGQQQINEQLLADCDVVVAMLWSKLGQPTARAESGTAEEIEFAEKEDKKVHVLICRRSPPDGHDAVELDRLKSYVEKVRKRGLTVDFKTTYDLREVVGRCLNRDARELAPITETRKTDPGFGSIDLNSSGATSRLRNCNSLARFASTLEWEDPDPEMIDETVRSINNFGNVLANVTSDARRLLSIVMRIGAGAYGHRLGLLEIGRRMDRSPEDIWSLCGELARFDLVYLMNEEDPTAELVIEDNPARIGWDFLGDLWKFEEKAPDFKIEEVLEGLNLAALDAPPE